MAERRMFAKSIIDSDMFIDMPTSSRLLYYDLSMRADDDGFVNSPKKIMRMTGASDDDLKMLVAKSFLIPFESGVVVIKHWKIHNYIQNDRYKPTIYTEEKALLLEEKNKEYSLDTSCIQNVSNLDTQIRLGKVRVGKDSIDESSVGSICGDDSPQPTTTKPSKKKTFIPPTVQEVQAYCLERQNNIDAERFVDYYTSNGWKVGKNSMKDWKAALRTWERKEKEGGYHGTSSRNFDENQKNVQGEQRKYKYSGTVL